MKESDVPLVIPIDEKQIEWDEKAWLEFRNCGSIITLHEDGSAEEELIRIPRGSEKEPVVIHRSDWDKMEDWLHGKRGTGKTETPSE